ncbi:MAG: hypothetical protein JWO82_1160 [Akkermansiaceae bacterium]|nr:hypothetical protein [Akkermansiaceae bacterium]
MTLVMDLGREIDRCQKRGLFTSHPSSGGAVTFLCCVMALSLMGPGVGRYSCPFPLPFANSCRAATHSPSGRRGAWIVLLPTTMKSNVFRVLRLSLLSATLIATAAATDRPAYVTNKVTFSGKITSATAAVVAQTATTYSSTSQFVSRSITNATVLDAMVVAGDLPAKTGYTLVERFSDQGDSSGFFAINSRTGSEVKVDPAIFSSFMNDSTLKGAEAAIAKARRTSTGAVTSVNSKFILIGYANFLSQPATPFITGSRKLVIKGSHTYIATDYSAIVRLPLDDETVVDAIIKSNGSVYTPPYTETGTVIINVPFSSWPAVVIPAAQ